MNDELYGRLWCQMMGKEPLPGNDYPNILFWKPIPGLRPSTIAKNQIERIIYDCLIDNQSVSKEHAYSSLGKALRSIHLRVPVLSGRIDMFTDRVVQSLSTFNQTEDGRTTTTTSA